MAKAQGSIEFIVIILAATFFLTTFFLIVQENIRQTEKEDEKLIVTEIAKNIQNEINLAATASEGYSREFKVAENINAKDYIVRVAENLVYVEMQGASIALATSNVSGQIQKGINKIKKENNNVYLN